MKRISLLILPLLLIGLLHPMRALALSEHYYDEDFIIASIVIADPSDCAMYSTLGHACIRMQCPSEGLDLCFSYEGELCDHQMIRFLAGNLHMGMFAVPIEDYLDCYRKDGRGVYEYRLNLPLETRRELWRLLDEQMMKGAYLKYDYFYRGCAITSLHFIEKSLGDKKIEYGPWDLKYSQGTTRQVINIASYGFPFFRYVMATLAGNQREVDGRIRNADMLVIPLDLVHALQNATIDGVPVLSNECHVLNKGTAHYKAPWLTSEILAVLLIVLTLINFFIRRPYIDWLVLGLVSIIGLLMTYLVIFSRLPLTDFNILIIPFNLLPLIAWKWRRYWALPFAGLVLVWLLVIAAWPHFLVYPSNIMLAIAWILVLLKQSPKFEQIRLALSSGSKSRK